MPSFSVDFLAAGGTRHPSAADWNASSGILAFGAGRNVALWRPRDGDAFGIHALLKGHTDTVNVVKTFSLPGIAGPILLSGAADNTIRVWCPNQASETGYRCTQVLDEHKKSINAIAVLPELSIFASSSADVEVKLWRIEAADSAKDVRVTLTQVLPLKPKYFPLTLALARLPSTDSPVLAVAGSKAFVQLYIQKSGKFELAATLTGHEGWIRSLEFVQEGSGANGDLLLASASQDKYIRLWRLRHGAELPASSDALSDPSLDSIGRSLSNKAHRFTTAEGKQYSVTFEALLLGHEDWIFTTRWHKNDHTIRLLSASADNSLAIWEPDPSSGIWVCTVRLGEISAQKGATTATGSTGGFWIGLWGPDGTSVASLGRTGGWRLWNHGMHTDMWEQITAVGGHTREVRGVAWAKDGSYLLSTSSDQTSRLYAPWRRDHDHAQAQHIKPKPSWHELSRPQIHGYDLNCIDTFGTSQFVSGADEKLLRVFDEPKGVADLLASISGVESKATKPLPELASIPVLGLSNKAIDTSAPDDDDNDNDSPNDALQTSSTPTAPSTSTTTLSQYTTPPTEDTLSRSLLWPETEKLYGHGHEISCLAASPTSDVVATACRASSVEHAVIRLYDTTSWLEIDNNNGMGLKGGGGGGGKGLQAHSLTVTSLRWSGDGEWLLSTGRDRGAVVWRRVAGEGKGRMEMFARNEKAHTRMLLDGSWAPLTPQTQHPVFATAGRDKNVHIWQLHVASQSFERVATIPAPLPVVAIAFLWEVVGKHYVLAYALEDGAVNLARIGVDDFEVKEEVTGRMPESLAPAMAVTQMVWRPRPGNEEEERGANGSGGNRNGEKTYKLAIASEDASLRIFSIDLNS